MRQNLQTEVATSRQKIICGDNREVLKEFEENSFDSIVTDPPYEIKFMSRKWDASGIAYDIEMWKECLRVLKPGGHLLAFGGTRTYHRMACAIEDAGFEIRDQIQWIYSSGFPKSLNIGKEIAKLRGEEIVRGELKYKGGNQLGQMNDDNWKPKDVYEEIVVNEWTGWGTALKPAHEPIVVARKPLEEKTVIENVLNYCTGGINIGECRIAGPEPHHNYGRTSGENSFVGKSENASVTPSNGKWPANVILECTCENVERRVQNSEPYVYSNNEYDVAGYISKCKPNAPSNYNDKDSFVIHTNPDCPCLILDQQSGITKSGLMRAGQKRNIGYGGYNGNMPGTATEKDTYADSGGASRFFYVAKASRKERDAGLKNSETKLFGQSSSALTKLQQGQTEYLHENHIGLNKIKKVKNDHPTVKPIELIKYLVRLITPTGGRVLDPFAGSGTTGIACALEGFDFVGIEQEEEYCRIAEARIEYWQNKIEKEKDNQPSFFDKASGE